VTTSDAAIRRRRAARVVEKLQAAYGTPDLQNKADPLDELVFIILSQMTTQPSYYRVYDRLRAACATWEDLLAMPAPRLRVLIRDAGLSQQKAPRLRSIMRRLRHDFGRATLEPLALMGTRSAEAYLTSLPGVGVKTAKCVLLFSLGREVLPVDTHVARVGRRLGLVDESVTGSQIHGALEAVVAPGDRHGFHLTAIAHGRAVCLPLRPRCATCLLRRLCPTGIRHRADAPAAAPTSTSDQPLASRRPPHRRPRARPR
jgi:endonuclease III